MVPRTINAPSVLVALQTSANMSGSIVISHSSCQAELLNILDMHYGKR